MTTVPRAPRQHPTYGTWIKLRPFKRVAKDLQADARNTALFFGLWGIQCLLMWPLPLHPFTRFTPLPAMAAYGLIGWFLARQAVRVHAEGFALKTGARMRVVGYAGLHDVVVTRVSPKPYQSIEGTRITLTAVADDGPVTLRHLHTGRATDRLVDAFLADLMLQRAAAMRAAMQAGAAYAAESFEVDLAGLHHRRHGLVPWTQLTVTLRGDALVFQSADGDLLADLPVEAPDALPLYTLAQDLTGRPVAEAPPMRPMSAWLVNPSYVVPLLFWTFAGPWLGVTAHPAWFFVWVVTLGPLWFWYASTHRYLRLKATHQTLRLTGWDKAVVPLDTLTGMVWQPFDEAHEALFGFRSRVTLYRGKGEKPVRFTIPHRPSNEAVHGLHDLLTDTVTDVLRRRLAAGDSVPWGAHATLSRHTLTLKPHADAGLQTLPLDAPMTLHQSGKWLLCGHPLLAKPHRVHLDEINALPCFLLLQNESRRDPPPTTSKPGGDGASP